MARAAALIVFAPTQQCVYVDDSPGHHRGSGDCTGTAIPAWIGIPLLILAIAGPVVTAVYLASRARRAVHQAAEHA